MSKYWFKYLNPADHNPRRITKADKDFFKKLDFKDKKYWFKIRDIHKLEKKNSIGISVFGYEKEKEKYSIYVSKKCCKEKHVDLLLRGEREKKHYVLINYFNRFMHEHCLNAFITEGILKRHIKNCFKINGNKWLRCLRKANMLNSKIFKEK